MLSAITHRRARGEAAELCFIARASQFGLNVSKPLGGCLPYDVIVGYASHLHRVQAKSTMQYDPRSRRYRCQIVRADRSQPYSPDDVEFIAVYVIPEDLWYIIPMSTLRARHISLRPRDPRSRYYPYEERWELFMQPPAAARTSNLIR